MKYQMLPHARPGGMAGLLELLLDKGGRDDIYRLADDLAFEIDDLLPIVDAAQLLGFLKIEEGDAAITEPARSLPIRKFCGRRNCSAMRRSKMFCCFARFAAPSKPRATTPFRRTSSSTCSTSSSATKKRCGRWRPPITWGRYAELFDFDAARRRFVMPDALEEEAARRRRRRVNIQHPFARSLVTVRTWPFVHRLGRRDLCALAIFLGIVRMAAYWMEAPVPVVPISHSIARPAALRVLLHRAHRRLPMC